MTEEKEREIKISIWTRRKICKSHECLLDEFDNCPKYLERDNYACNRMMITTKIKHKVSIPNTLTKKEEHKFRLNYQKEHGLSPDEEKERINRKRYRKNPQLKNKDNIYNQLDLIFTVPGISDICKKFLFRVN